MQVISNVLNADRPAIVVISDVADICPRFGFGVMVIRCCLVLQVWGLMSGDKCHAFKCGRYHRDAVASSLATSITLTGIRH